MATTAQDIIIDALRERNAIQIGAVPSGDDAAFVLIRLNNLIDSWNAERPAVYAETFNSYTLTANLQPHTIGPSSATFSATVRPVSIEAANIVLTNVSPNVRVPLNIRDFQWWAANTVQGVTSTLPTDLYYSPGWQNGSLYLWPVPTVASDLELVSRVLLSSLALTDTFTLPPGYKEAITLTLAEYLPAQYGPLDPSTAIRAREARARIFANNDIARRLTTKDTGMPDSGEARPYFNYLTGEPL